VGSTFSILFSMLTKLQACCISFIQG
jgi:hypothetical protein